MPGRTGERPRQQDPLGVLRVGKNFAVAQQVGQLGQQPVGVAGVLPVELLDHLVGDVQPVPGHVGEAGSEGCRLLAQPPRPTAESEEEPRYRVLARRRLGNIADVAGVFAAGRTAPDVNPAISNVALGAAARSALSRSMSASGG